MPSDPREMISLYRVEKIYPPNQPALAALDLKIERGEFVFIAGASGAGKSTLLKLLFAQEIASKGSVIINGRNLSSFNRSQVAAHRRSVGVIFQDYKLLHTRTALENVAFALEVVGVKRTERNQRAFKMLSAVGLKDRVNAFPQTLSGGEQQRVAIARALLFSPGVIFADEPTGNLDSVSSGKLWKLLGDLAIERQMLVVMVTHEPAAAANCKSVFVLADGAVKATMETEGLDAAGVAARYQQYLRTA